MKEFLARPGFLGTFGTLGADLSYLLALVFTSLFLVGWYMARNHRGKAHHGITLWAMTTMLVYFVSYYLIRRLGVLAFEGREGFGGPDWVYYNFFRPILLTHIFLVCVAIVMAVYMIILGFRASSKEDGKMSLKNDVLKIKKKNFYIGLLLALVILGLLAFVRCRTLGCVMVYVIGFLIIAFVLLLEKIFEWLLPSGAKRHRLLGRLTMVMYLLLLITSTLTYILLYISYIPKLSGAYGP